MSDVLTTIFHLGVFVTLIVTVFYFISLSAWLRDFFYKQLYSRKEKMVMIVIFGFLGILASEYGFKIIGVVANVRDCIAIFAGILGGPAVGIGAGLISGFYRITGLWWKGWTGNLGYWSAVGCGLATIGAGFLGAWLSKKGINLRKITSREIGKIVLITILWEVIHIHLFVPLTAPLYTEKTFWEIQEDFFKKIMFPMGLLNALGIFLFLTISRDIVLKREVELALKELKEKTSSKNGIN